MSNDSPVQVFEGRLSRKLNNALTMSFHTGPGDPIGTALQSGADGAGSKLGVLFGFKNGGTGTHVYTPASGLPLLVESSKEMTTKLTRVDGSEVGSIERGEVCTARTPDGTPVLCWTDDADPKTLEAFKLLLSTPGGEQVGRLNIIRTNAGWSLGRDLLETAIWWGHAGQPLKLPLLGTSARLFRPLNAVEHEMLIASCIDIAIGLRPYGLAMR